MKGYSKEMKNFAKLNSKSKNVSLKIGTIGAYKDDYYRLLGETGSNVIYFVSNINNTFDIFCYSEDGDQI